MAEIPKLHHVTVEVSPENALECIRFYRGVLGLTEITSPVPGSTWFEEGVHLYWGNESDPFIQYRWLAARHFALVVGDQYERIIEECTHKSLFVHKGTQYWGSPRSYIVDPAGNRIEIMETPPS